MTRLWRLLAVAGIVAMTAAAYALPAGATQSVATYKDRFGAVAYDGNDGTADFSGPWVESNDGGGAASGAFAVTGHAYCDGNCLTIGGLLVALNNASVTRSADLEGVDEAILEWDWGRQILLLDGGAVRAEVSEDGDDWDELVRMRLDGTDGGLPFHESHDITEYAGPNTMIRFRSTSGTQVAAYLLIDDVRITATTSSSSTTTTTSPTTTTTTTMPGATTTTSSTTTTTVGATTTTAPSTSTTTTTTSPPSTTTITHPFAATTTTTTTTPTVTTTTTTVPDDDDAGTTPNPPTDPGGGGGHRAADMVISLSGEDGGIDMRMPDAAGSAGDGLRLSPLENLGTMFTIAGGTVRSTGLAAVALGLLLAALAVRGLGDRMRFRNPRPSTAD